MLRSVRAIAMVGLMVASTGCTPLDDVMVAIFGRSMRDQRSFNPYENPVMPPENSVPFAAGNFNVAPGQFNTGQPQMSDVPAPFTQADLFTPAVTGLANPVSSDAASLARGQQMYQRVCAVCHGETGIGAQAFIADKHPMLVAYNLSDARIAAYTDGFIYGKIRVGGPIMPAYGHQVTHIDRWHIVNYVRELQRRAGNLPAGGGAAR